jgi:hypothetical protein
MSQSRSILALIAALVCLTAPMPSTLVAQGQRPKTGAVHVFKGGGGDRSTPGRKPPPAPVPLTAAAVNKLIGGVPANLYVKLTPNHPSVVNRGGLNFFDSAVVEGLDNYATWNVYANGGLAIWLRPVAGKKYLIDCSVQSKSKNALFKITGPSGTAPMQVSAIPEGQHLVFLLDATDNKWQHFEITAVGTYLTPIEWTFYSCEVTNL